ncbi:uncharacterized protein LOC110233931 [Exaiptasia diaphana]|uniref:RBR-type E3 ubiquitin transferase n=1 Tax=Exaiptasia diaphana TaxID=2652724 RepID=A0A913WW14_EXADI|nr:uncharacterized protein LOC110233931 [Exaiptasia diaphana]KXJ17464.1 putative E3 ubiquitin-protein ligase ARI7 [Exaiptasia diaphana]
MTWKGGKHRTGRTIRSSFPRRKEGILVLKKERKSDHDEAEKVLYSLGKHNRWMMPEMVKESSGFRGDFGDEDFVLVDRRTKKKIDLSIYESSSGNILGSYSKLSNIELQASEADVVFEVSSPDHKGVWPFEGRLKYQDSSRKKKHTPKHRHTYMTKDWDEEDSFVYDEEFDAECDNSLMDHSLYLSDYMPEIPYKNKKSPSNAKRVRKRTSNNNKEPLFPQNKVIIVDDEESTKEHKRIHALTRKRDIMLERILLDVHDCKWCWGTCWDNKNRRKRRQKYMRKKLSLIGEEVDDNAEHQEQQDSKELSAYEFCEIRIVDNDVQVQELTRVWGEHYNEGGSFPRKFAIDISDSNLTPCKTSPESIHILFELKDNKDIPPNHKCASIKLLIDTELSEYKIPRETSQLIIKDFKLAMSTSSDVLSVEDVVNRARICIEKHLSMKETISSSKKSTSLDQFEGHFGWKGEVYMGKEAIAEVKKDLDNKPERNCDLSTSYNHATAAECGICLENLIDPVVFTTMTSCGHSFCNKCWKTYIDTKLKNGQVDLLCPEHCCKTVVDHVTVMALAPSWYGKYISWKVKRTMAASRSWKNCPSEKCNLVMKVLPKDNSKVIPVGMPISCACKNIWCYSCQEQAHWPSPCSDANKFRAANTGRGSFGDFPEITSVSVKKCPNCSYPIEKNEGCNYMFCIMCNTAFCWYCLEAFLDYDYDHRCYTDRKEKKLTAVELPLLLSDTQRFAYIAVRSFYIVKAGMSVQKEQRLKCMEKGMEAYLSLQRISKAFHTSTLDTMMKVNLTDVVRKAYTFELQAHIAVEGMAIGIVYGDKTFLEQCMILAYIMEKVAEFLNTPCSLYKTKNIARLNKLIGNGQQCLKRVLIKKLKH